MKPTVAVIGRIRFPAEEVPNILPHLRALVEATNKNDGCIAYDVGEDPFHPGLFRFSELWPDRNTLSKHLQAPHIQPWREAARKHGLLERSFAAYDVSGESSV